MMIDNCVALDQLVSSEIHNRRLDGIVVFISPALQTFDNLHLINLALKRFLGLVSELCIQLIFGDNVRLFFLHCFKE